MPIFRLSTPEVPILLPTLPNETAPETYVSQLLLGGAALRQYGPGESDQFAFHPGCELTGQLTVLNDNWAIYRQFEQVTIGSYPFGRTKQGWHLYPIISQEMSPETEIGPLAYNMPLVHPVRSQRSVEVFGFIFHTYLYAEEIWDAFRS